MAVPYDPPPALSGLSLTDLAAAVAARRLPPIERWSPQRTGTSDIRIAADGRWYHQGEVISRPAMVRAFASLLLRDSDGQHWLVTPFERLAIEVEDAAFLAVDVAPIGDAPEPTLGFRLNTDELIVAGPEHRLRMDGTAEAPAAYLDVRHGLQARLDRSTWLQVAELALAQSSAERPFVTSGGVRFDLSRP